MKSSIIALLFLSFATVSLADTVRLSEPVTVDEESETFGAEIGSGHKNTTLSDVLSAPDDYLAEEFALQVEVKKVCQKKGCFFVAQEGATTIRVEFKDYGFFVPTDIGGKTVTLVGTLKEREMSEEDAAHYSKDLGEEGSIKAGLMHEIVATAVRVPRNL